MVRVEHFDRGKLKIDGQVYDSDLIICPDKIYTNWRRMNDVKLSIYDLQLVLPHRPATLVIGTGQNQQLQIDDFTQSKLKDLGFEIYIAKTRPAIRRYNSLSSNQKTIGIFCLK